MKENTSVEQRWQGHGELAFVFHICHFLLFPASLPNFFMAKAQPCTGVLQTNWHSTFSELWISKLCMASETAKESSFLSSSSCCFLPQAEVSQSMFNVPWERWVLRMGPLCWAIVGCSSPWSQASLVWIDGSILEFCLWQPPPDSHLFPYPTQSRELLKPWSSGSP